MTHTDLPQQMSFDELIIRSDFHDFSEMGRTWTVVLRDGTYYSGTGDTGQKCDGANKLDAHRFAASFR
jgi:hypothetical protein